MGTLDYIVLVLYFLGLVAVGLLMSRRIRSSEDMFIAGRNSSWWLSGISSYMTIFSAGTFVIWGGVAYKSGLVAVIVAMLVGVASLLVGRFIAGRWRRLRINSPGDYLGIRFGHSTVGFYTISGIIARGVHTATTLYAVAVIMCALIKVPEGSFLASTLLPGDSAEGYLSIWWALLILGSITLLYTVVGGFLAVLMTDVIQFGVLLCVVIFIIPLSFNAVGGIGSFIEKAGAIPGFFSGTSPSYTWLWLFLWLFLNVALVGGDWPFVQRYLSVPTVKDAKKSTYLIGALYLVTPLIWYLPTMIYRTIEPGPGMDVDPAAMTRLGEGAYVGMSKLVLMSGMFGMMLSAMLSATLSSVSGTLNVYANVYTCEIWGKRHKDASEKRLIRCGRTFTLVFGIAILGLSMLVPFAGGAEKVVVALLTMVICPLYIPSIWGLFSKRLSGGQLIGAMIATWVIGFTAKFTIPAEVMSQSLIESVSGLVLPLLLLSSMEIVSALKGRTNEGFARMQNSTDPDCEKEPDAEMKAGSKSYSNMAATVFCITIGVIATMLVGLLVAGDPRTVAVKGIVLGFVSVIFAVILSYVIYRIIDSRK